MMETGSIGKPQSSAGAQKTPAADDQKAAKLRKATQEFESIFVGYLLKTMRSTIQKSDDAQESFGGDIMDGMFDMEMAKHISQKGGIGIGKMLYRQMTGGQHPAVSSDGKNVPQDGVGPLSLPPRLKNTPAVPDTVSKRVGAFNDVIREAAEAHSVDANVLKAVIATESGGKADAVSGKDARGLMQLLDSTAADMGVKDSLNPRENVLGGAKYLKQLLDQFDGNLKLALAAYNAGPGAVVEHQGIPPFKETKDYVNRVMDYLHAFEEEDK